MAILDVLTLPEAKRAINMQAATAEQDDILERHIATVSTRLDDLCGPVVKRAIAAEEHNGGRPSVRLNRRPVVSISLVREARYGTIETLTAQSFGSTGDGYRAPKWERDPTQLSGVLERRRFGCRYPWAPGTATVEITYIAGRYDTTATVGDRFKDAAGAVLRRLWKREAGSWAQTISFLDDENKPASGFFKVADPVINELLWDDVQTHLVNFR